MFLLKQKRNGGYTDKQEFTTTGNVQIAVKLTDTETRNRMQATKLILSLPIGKSTIKAGAEIYRVVSGNDQKTSSEVIMNSESEVTETTVAAFGEYSLASALGQLTAGFRYEHVSMDYRDNVNSESVYFRM